MTAGMVGLAPNWVRLVPNGTNPGLFQIRFQYIWLYEPNVLKCDLKKSWICPILGQSEPIWSQTYHPCMTVTSHFCSVIYMFCLVIIFLPKVAECMSYKIIRLYYQFVATLNINLNPAFEVPYLR